MTSVSSSSTTTKSSGSSSDQQMRQLATMYYDYMTFRTQKLNIAHKLSIEFYLYHLKENGVGSFFGVGHNGKVIVQDSQEPELFFEWIAMPKNVHLKLEVDACLANTFQGVIDLANIANSKGDSYHLCKTCSALEAAGLPALSDCLAMTLHSPDGTWSGETSHLICCAVAQIIRNGDPMSAENQAKIQAFSERMPEKHRRRPKKNK